MELVAQAANGREGIEQFRQHLPDIVLMDLQMPETSGMDAILAIRGVSRCADHRADNILRRCSGSASIESGSSSLSTKESAAQGTFGDHPDLACGAENDVCFGSPAQLPITEEAVKSRIKHILVKLNANDRTHAAMVALKRGIIEL
jgi:hypothetical protein